MSPTDGLRALAEPLLTAAGLELWDIEVSRDLVRVLVDRREGVDLDALTDASRALSALLDERDDLVPAGGYQLEISSPGLERALRTPAQYGRYLGAKVSVKTAVAVAGSRRHRGTLVAADDHGCTLLAEGVAGASPIEVRYDDIERTHVVLDWGPAPKPGGRTRSATAPRAQTLNRRVETSQRAGAPPAGPATPNPKDAPR